MLILLGLAQVQFFFGYAESYTMMTVAMTLFLYFGWRYVSENGHFWAAVLAFLMSGFCHLSGWFALPGLLYLLWLRGARDGRRVFHVAAVIVALVALTAAAVFYIKFEESEIFAPVVATEMNPYHLLSVWHIKDMGNLLLLVAPLPMLIILLSTLSRTTRLEFRSRAAVFLGLCLVGTLFFSLTIDPKLGAFRDWDLLALYGVPGAFLALTIIRAPVINARTHTLVAGVAMAFIAVHTIPWVSSNTMQERTRVSAKALVRTDVHYAPEYYRGYRLTSWGVIMAGVFGDLEEKAWAFGQRIKGDPDDHRARVVYASALDGIGQDSLAARALRGVTDLDQLLDVNLHVLVDLQHRYMMFDDARKTAVYALDRYPDDVHFISMAASSCLMLGDFKTSLEYFKSGLRLDPNDVDLIIKAAAAAVGAEELGLAASLIDRASSHPELSERDRSDIARLKQMLRDSSDE
jgi:hypothetical protein